MREKKEHDQRKGPPGKPQPPDPPDPPDRPDRPDRRIVEAIKEVTAAIKADTDMSVHNTDQIVAAIKEQTHEAGNNTDEIKQAINRLTAAVLIVASKMPAPPTGMATAVDLTVATEPLGS